MTQAGVGGVILEVVGDERVRVVGGVRSERVARVLAAQGGDLDGIRGRRRRSLRTGRRAVVVVGIRGRISEIRIMRMFIMITDVLRLAGERPGILLLLVLHVLFPPFDDFALRFSGRVVVFRVGRFGRRWTRVVPLRRGSHFGLLRRRRRGRRWVDRRARCVICGSAPGTLPFATEGPYGHDGWWYRC